MFCGGADEACGRSGSGGGRAAQVTEGDGRMLVCAVGVHSEWGQTMALVVGEAADTPLQEKLTVLAGAIGKVGLAVALLCFIVLMIRYPLDLARLNRRWTAIAHCDEADHSTRDNMRPFACWWGSCICMARCRVEGAARHLL